MKKIATVFFISLLLLSVLFLIDSRLYVRANPRTLIVDDDGPPSANFTKIQDAINNATSGDTILVHNGTYYEDIIVNKSLSIIGENRDFTIINGTGTVNVVFIRADFVTIKGFTIRKSGRYTFSGIRIEQYSNITIIGNKITDNYEGISFYYSFNNLVSENLVANNYVGISLYQTSNSIFSENTVRLNGFSGIFLSSSNNNTVDRNMIQSNIYGIYVLFSNNDKILSNTILSNDQGISLVAMSSNNMIYHNNFNNAIQASSEAVNFWNSAYEGNYWADYNGTDNNRDGIGDYPYIIDESNQDNYPLMGSFSRFEIASEAKTYTVAVISNSTVSDLQFKIGEETGNRIIQYNVTGMSGSVSFSRITVPSELLRYPYIVVLDGAKITPAVLNSTDATEILLYFTYSSENSTIRIISSETMRLYYELLAKNLELQGYINSLNETYYNFLNDYNILLGNYSSLLNSLYALNASYQQHLSDYSLQLENMRSLMYIVAATAAIFMVTTVYLSKNTNSKVFPRTRLREDEE